jgi:hypothetical protein
MELSLSSPIGTLADRFGEVIEDLRKFAIPMFRCIALGKNNGKQWSAGAGWLAEVADRAGVAL